MMRVIKTMIRKYKSLKSENKVSKSKIYRTISKTQWMNKIKLRIRREKKALE